MNVHQCLQAIINKGGSYYRVRRKRMTKRKLQGILRKGEKLVSPEVGTEVVESGDNVQLNLVYNITNVEDVTTEVSFYQGLRVEMIGADNSVGSVMLWKRPKTGKGSKLGVFIQLLGSNTDAWIGKFVVFTKWERNNRVMLPATHPNPLVQAATSQGATLGKAPKASKKK